MTVRIRIETLLSKNQISGDNDTNYSSSMNDQARSQLFSGDGSLRFNSHVVYLFAVDCCNTNQIVHVTCAHDAPTLVQAELTRCSRSIMNQVATPSLSSSNSDPNNALVRCIAEFEFVVTWVDDEDPDTCHVGIRSSLLEKCLGQLQPQLHNNDHQIGVVASNASAGSTSETTASKSNNSNISDKCIAARTMDGDATAVITAPTTTEEDIVEDRTIDQATETPKIIDPESAVAFLHMVGLLKRVKRTGWVLRGVPSPESVCDHSYRMAVAALLLLNTPNTVTPNNSVQAEEEESGAQLDISRVVMLSLVHDLAEAVAGDIAPGQGVSDADKLRLEEESMEKIVVGTIGSTSATGAFIMRLWHEYEDRNTAEAKVVKDLDRLEMVVSAAEYERKEARTDLGDFYESVRGKVVNSQVRAWADVLFAEREERLLKLASSPPKI